MRSKPTKASKPGAEKSLVRSGFLTFSHSVFLSMSAVIFNYCLNDIRVREYFKSVCWAVCQVMQPTVGWFFVSSNH